ncbi:Cytochrome P450 4C1 [Blattella germanica]|nr:Cytochrome P450 4C1 [Blattella germanica]
MNILVNQLSKEVNGPEFDICPYISLYTLDNICETAMGVTVNAQLNSSSEYVKAVNGMGDVLYCRLARPWLHNDFLFKYSSLGRQQKKSLAILHSMTNAVIKRRKQELLKKSQTKNKNENGGDEKLGIKTRLAFLDLMIQFSEDGIAFTDEEMREEVDTFMFEARITFALYALSKDQNIQEKVVQELRQIFGDSKRPTTFSDLQKMSYLEMVIKESLRLYPSVPMYGRKITENVQLGDFTLPAGADIGIVAFILHRNADIYPDPLKFDPDRFLPENCVTRHPYSYIPFSAGPRNCIGQKFGMMELKYTISTILRRYKILRGDSNEDMEFRLNLILKPLNGIKVKLQNRYQQ